MRPSLNSFSSRDCSISSEPRTDDEDVYGEYTTRRTDEDAAEIEKTEQKREFGDDLYISQYVFADKGIKIESNGKIPSKLKEAGIINKNFSERMQRMIGFRNRAIHNYPSLEEK